VRALGYARDAGLVIDQDGLLEAATEDSVLRNNKSLRSTGYIEELEGRIRAHILAEGFASLDNLASSVQAAKDDPSFLAALHRALRSGDVHWVNVGTYGLPVEQLRRFERSGDLVASEPAGLSTAAARLSAAAQALARAMAHHSTSSGPDLPSAAGLDDDVVFPPLDPFPDAPEAIHAPPS
jgi:hypothetical protein